MEVDFGVLDDGGDAVLNDDVTFDFSFFDSEVFMLRGLVVLEIDLGEVTYHHLLLPNGHDLLRYEMSFP